MKIGNIIYQWGTEEITVAEATDQDITFPVTFPNAPWVVICSPCAYYSSVSWQGPNEATKASADSNIFAQIKNASTFTINHSSGTAVVDKIRFHYFSVGW